MLNPRQLEAFRTVLIVGSVTGAAEQLRISQPAVSRLLRDLGQELCLTLFTKEGGKLVPTKEALRLFQEVERVFNSYRHLIDVADHIRAGNIGSLNIVAMPSLVQGALAEAISRFLQERQSIKVTIHSEPSQNIPMLVAAGQYDVGIGTVPAQHPGFKAIALPPKSALCAIPVGHRLATRERIALSDFGSEALLCLGSGSVLRQRFQAAISKLEVKPKLLVEATTSMALCSLAEKGLGIAIIDPFSSANCAHFSNIVIKPFFPAIPYECAIFISTNSFEGVLAQDFVHVFSSYVEEICGSTIGD